MKKCQICGKRASVFLTQIIDGKATELALCPACAKAKGLFDPQALAFAEKFFPEDFRKSLDKLAEELGVAAESVGEDPEKKPRVARNFKLGNDLLTRCPACGFTLENFRQTGRLGCPDCYAVFAHELHGDGKEPEAHSDTEETTGGQEQPSPAVRKAMLENRMREAIAREDYEEAAKLRDEIRNLEDGADDGEA